MKKSIFTALVALSLIITVCFRAQTVYAAEASGNTMPYLEAKGVNFTTISSVDGYHFFTFVSQQEDGAHRLVDPAYKILSKSSRFTITGINTRNTGDGFKEYVITTTCEAPLKVSYPAENGALWYTGVTGLDFCDYYTGLILNTGSTQMDINQTNNNGSAINKVSWDGVEYTITIKTEINTSNRNGAGDLNVVDGIGTYSRTDTSNCTYVVRCPEGYDGLCLCVQGAAQLPANTEEKYWNAHFDSNGKYCFDYTAYYKQIRYMFKSPDICGTVFAPNNYLIMRVTG